MFVDDEHLRSRLLDFLAEPLALGFGFKKVARGLFWPWSSGVEDDYLLDEVRPVERDINSPEQPFAVADKRDWVEVKLLDGFDEKDGI